MQNFFLRLKNRLEEAGSITASFELRQIFAQLSGDPFYEIRLENEFSEEQLRAAEDMVDRRIAGEPLQYILGEWEFMGLPFFVGKGVLIPRPETELLCEKGLDFLEKRPAGSRRTLDLCCGTGCLGICAAKYIPGTVAVCADKFDVPLEYTGRNAERNGVKVEILRADALLAPPEGIGKFDLIMTNPPYVTDRDMDTLQKEVRYEPEEALRGGEDGLDFYRSILAKWSGLLVPGGALMAEVGAGEAGAVAELFSENGFSAPEVTEDYCGIPRIVSGVKE